MASKRTGRGVILFGLLVLLAGIAGAIVLYVLSGQRDDDAIRDLARAPVGCDTTLDFSDTGTFYVFIEHLGRVDTLDGDCETPNEYSRDPAEAPRVTITLTDREGTELELDRLDEEFTYTLGDSFAGTASRRFEIDTTGDYVMTVESDDGTDFVVAIGRDPSGAGDTTRLGALASGIAGIALGLGLVLVGIRRARRWRRVVTVYTARPPGWPGGTPMPTAPPVMQPPLTQPVAASRQPGQWSPAPPVGPPIASPSQPPAGPYVPADRAIPGSFAPPRFFAPPEVPILPAPPPGHSPIAPPSPMTPRDPAAPRDPIRGGAHDDDRGDSGVVRDDA
jgi:hypothetical protein